MKNKGQITSGDYLDLGDIRVFPLSDGSIRLDGGAMFGVVPRVLWERDNPPDEKNRIPLGIRPILIETAEKKILVETGMGGRWDERERRMYGIEREETLEGSLRSLGHGPGDVDMVINTHLHFDHAGGNCWVDPTGVLVPAFPSARYLVQRVEFENAAAPNERTHASYRPGDFMPLEEAGLLELIDTPEGEETMVAEGVFVFRTSGHNAGIQLVRVEGSGGAALFLSDIVPTASHIAYPYIAAYDLFPLDTLEVKKRLIGEAARRGWFLFFYHDPVVRCATVDMEDGSPRASRVL